MWLIIRLLLCFTCSYSFSAYAKEERDACGQNSTCQQLEDQGRELFEKKDYRGALAAYNQAYNLVNAHEFLINIGRLQYRLGLYDEAMNSFSMCSSSQLLINDAELLKRYIMETKTAVEIANRPRLDRRIALPIGIPLLVGGVALLSLGIASVVVNGQCAEESCKRRYDSVVDGSVELTFGGVSTVSGITLIVLGSRPR